MGAMMESGRKRRNPMIGCQLKTTARAIILLDVVATKTGAWEAKSFSFLSRPCFPCPVCSIKFTLPKVKYDSAPAFPIITIELAKELAQGLLTLKMKNE